MSKTNAQVQITLVRSPIGRQPSHQATLKGLGLRKMHQKVVRQLTPELQGMINKISYMLKVEQVS